MKETNTAFPEHLCWWQGLEWTMMWKFHRDKKFELQTMTIGRKDHHIFGFSLVMLQFQDWVRQVNEPRPSLVSLF